MRAYRTFALENPALYRVMFGQTGGPGAAVGGQCPCGARRVRGPGDVVRRAAADGVLAAEDPETVAEVLWTAAHGVVSLEITGFLSRPPRGEATFEALLATLLGGGAGARTGPSRTRPRRR
jgi:hypothetical protein